MEQWQSQKEGVRSALRKKMRTKRQDPGAAKNKNRLDSSQLSKINNKQQDTAHKLQAALAQGTAPRSGQIKEGKTSSTKLDAKAISFLKSKYD
jgi:hypothetical protein